MGTKAIAGATLVALTLAGAAEAHGGHDRESGSMVGVSVEVEGRPAPLYAAPDGSRRHYLEAREGATYLVHLSNRTRERLGVVLSVDGLNAISGARDHSSGRMYVLGPWGRATVRGWRTSLRNVRRFVFVDEESSYAARSGKANARMGWIEVRVYRERRVQPHAWERDDAQREPAEGRAQGEPAPSAPRVDATASEAPTRSREEAGQRKRSYPGTGWGPRAHDPAVLVEFEPETSPAEWTTLRYEYRAALIALGVLPSPHVGDGRLRERDRGETGFAPPPLW